MTDTDALVAWYEQQLDRETELARRAAESHRISPRDADHALQCQQEGILSRPADQTAHPEDLVGRPLQIWPMPSARARYRHVNTQLPGFLGGLELIEEYNPDRVLRAVATGRQILTSYNSALTALRNAPETDGIRALMQGAVNTYRHVLLMHAAEYADRPGYREEWRP